MPNFQIFKKNSPYFIGNGLISLFLLASCAFQPAFRQKKLAHNPDVSNSTDGKMAYTSSEQKAHSDTLRPLLEESLKTNRGQEWVAYFTGRGRDLFNKYGRNGREYQTIVENILDEYSLPREIFFLGLIESGYQIRAKSRAGARGPWQFMKNTAKTYGLKVDHHLDERLAIIKSTTAAARYLKDLYNIFGDWNLAFSAYNAGEYKVLKSIRLGKTRSYHELSQMKLLPTETREYIPKMAAAREIFLNLEKYGMGLASDDEGEKLQIEDRVAFDLTHSIQVKDLAKFLNISESEFLSYAQEVVGRAIIVSPGHYFTLYLPRELQVKLTQIEKSEWNKVAYHESSKKGRVKKRGRHHNRHEEDGEDSETTSAYKVKKGDNLFAIARYHGVSVKKIMQANGLRNNRLYVGQLIQIPKV